MGLVSSIEGAAFPAVATGMAAEIMALQRQFDASQFWPPEVMRAVQWRQLRLLVAHAARQVPFHARRLRAAGIDPETFTEADWRRLPVLTRRDLQARGDALQARVVPKSHGATTTVSSGGSSGVPVRVRKTALDNLLWNAMHVRDEIWNRPDPAGTIVRIRGTSPALTPEQQALTFSTGLCLPDWGPPTSLLWQTGPIWLLNDHVPIAAQAAFLREKQADYLFTFPSNLRLLLAHFRETGERPPALRSVWTMSEVVDETMRAQCREVFGCRIVHNYSSAEAGYMALQCPDGDHFHVMSETLLLEVLRPDGTPCTPGEIGRVVLTPLHNFAMPLLRYEIGDEAEMGGPCACGRGLPVLRRIVGRMYDYLVLPSGRRQRVDTGFLRIAAIPAVREFQVVQRSLERGEILMVLSRPLTAAETAEIHQVLREKVSSELRFDIVVLDSIPRTVAGKLRIFVSDLAER